jgi:hypothetical protein
VRNLMAPVSPPAPSPGAKIKMGSPVPINRPKSIAETDRYPKNLEAERSVLGAILLDNAALKVAIQHVKPIEFFLPQHKALFNAMIEMDEKHSPIDFVLLVAHMEQAETLVNAGGAAYISQLADGMPRVSNVAHYARLVQKAFLQRQYAYLGNTLQEQALAGADVEALDIILANAEQVRQHGGSNPAVVVGFQKLLWMDMPPLEYAIKPLLTAGGTGEIYGWRGAGKSLIATKMAVDMAAGAPTLFAHKRAGGNWPVQKRYRILYVYGEMHGSMIQDRCRLIAKGADLPNVIEDEWLGTMCKDFQKAWRPNIATPGNRKIIEQHIERNGYEGVIFDNLSTLWPVSGEGEGERNAVLSDWFNDLNQRGTWIIYLHHAGKGGQQRGDSSKEDMVDFVLQLSRPHAKKEVPNLCCEVKIEKMRGECEQPGWNAPFEVQLETLNDIAHWTIRPAKDAALTSAFAMFANGAKAGDVFAELGIPRSTCFHYRKLWERDPIALHHLINTTEE